VSVRATHRQAVISYTAPDAAACSVEVYSSDLRVTAAANTNPIAVTVHRPHSLETGDRVYISGVSGNTNANGYHTVTVTSATAFTLDGAAGNGTYISGGLVQRLVHDVNPRIFGPGVDLDSRSGSANNLRQRTFVAGQIPIPGWDGYAPVEATSIPVAISSISRASNVATVNTASPHGLRMNDNVAIAGVEDGSFATMDARVTAVVDADTFKYASTGADGSSTGGTVTRANRYSRALQADADHRYRISCGADTYEGTFRTRTVPAGSSYGEIGAFDWSSAPMRYLDPSLPDQRGYEVIDPVTGVLAIRVSLDSDTFDPVASYSAGNQVSCAWEKTNTGTGGTPGYVCHSPTTGLTGRWYWHGDDGTVRFLGYPRVASGTEWESFFFNGVQIYPDSGSPNRFYTLYPQKTTLLPGFAIATLNSTAEVPRDSFVNLSLETLTPLAQGKNLLDLIYDFDARFSKSTYTATTIASVQGDYVTGEAHARGQDSQAWLWVLYLGDRKPLGQCTDCLRVVAAMPMYAHPKMRWCGYHYGNFVYPDHVFHMVAQNLAGGPATGPWYVILQNPAGVTAGDQSFTVNGEPTCVNTTCPTDGSTYLQDIEPGDVLQFMDGTNERIKVLAKSGTSWTVQRGYMGTTAAAHAAGSSIQVICECTSNMDAPKNDFFWKYLSDPHGRDMTNTYLIQDQNMYNGHRVERGDWGIIADWYLRKGTAYTGSPTYAIPSSPSYNGVTGYLYGNAYGKHPSFENWAAEGRNDWFIDTTPFQGITPMGTTSKVAGTSYIYKSLPSSFTDIKKAPHLEMSGQKVLLNISGPGAMLSDTIADNYKVCTAYKAGECWPGSAPGESYVNVPALNIFQCSSGSATADLCLFTTAAYGQAVAQFGIGPNGGERSRALIRGLAGPWRNWGMLTNSRTTPDGKWLLFTPRIGAERMGLLEALVPPMPARDNVNRMEFVPFPVRLAGRPGATRTVVEFGYDPELKWRCTQRAEGCVVDSATYDKAAPFKFADTDAVVGADCTAGCTMTVPAISDRVLYYRWKYRDADGNVLATGPVQAAAVTP